jgi:hypothetical protein
MSTKGESNGPDLIAKSRSVGDAPTPYRLVKPAITRAYDTAVVPEVFRPPRKRVFGIAEHRFRHMHSNRPIGLADRGYRKPE